MPLFDSLVEGRKYHFRRFGEGRGLRYVIGAPVMGARGVWALRGHLRWLLLIFVEPTSLGAWFLLESRLYN